MNDERRLSVRAYAKVNVVLLVAGKRADGYHDVVTLLAPIALADDVDVAITSGADVTLDVTGADIPADERNLAFRAAALYRKTTAWRPGVHIALGKNVPVGAGLGGGSSDAAAVLKAMAGRPLGADDLWRLAREIGSDVPFFLFNGWAVAAGRGEYITSVAGPAATPLLLAAPRRGIPTGRVYAAVNPTDWAAAPAPLWETLAALGAGVRAWWPRGTNDLEGPAIRTFPILGALKARLTDVGFGHARLSGSGGAFVAPVETADAAAARAALENDGWWSALTTTV